MSRSRNIKPALWLNEELAEVSIAARYLFPGLWCLADKDGRIEYRPKKIKAELYPYDKVCVISLIAELHGKKFLTVYESEENNHNEQGVGNTGKKIFIQINNFVKHQNPHPKEKSNGYPDPVNICTYNENEKQFNFTERNLILPFPSSSLIPSSLIPSIVGQAIAPRPKIPFHEIVLFLNEKVGSNFKSTTQATKNFIKSRFSEGFNLDDFKAVIDFKVDEWGTDSKFLHYLRPETLFGTKFESYLQASKSKERPTIQPKKLILPDLEKLKREKLEALKNAESAAH